MSFDDQLTVAVSCSHADCDRNVLNLSQACNNICSECCATLMPFFGVSDIEFTLLIDRTLLYNDNEYFSISRLNKLSSNNNKNNLFTLHFNTRSLPKNHDKIEEFLSELNVLPEIISVSETKLNSQSTSNVNIAQYDFLHNDSPSKAGGVGLYVKNNVKYSLRNDLNLHLSNCEDIWIEIYSKSKSIILSTITGILLQILQNFIKNYVILP